MKTRFLWALILTLFVGMMTVVSSFIWWWPQALAASPVGAGIGAEAMSWGFAAAAAATGLAALGAGVAVANVGAAAIGAITEKPELFGRVLILVGLAEGIAIYGLIVSILILNRLGG
ncbi:MAG: ATP synthase subunit C [Gammaproteobacteria bacterium]|nr:ATP synthase subunit C [Gammaproteobacteria bacterium]MDH3405486.1 ATP synthase subunit C [Gammaproteobacteria bacterium]MDH5487415.1 ATP synthase subunit C [Gammaproteobacteria bacterium]